MKSFSFFLITVSVLFTACIGDDYVSDFVQPEIRIVETPSPIAEGETFQLNPIFFNNIGQEENAIFSYSSSDESILTISEDGLINALSKGQSKVIVSTVYQDETISRSIDITVDQTTIIIEPETKSGTINTTSSYILEGEFTIETTDTGIQIDIDESYKADTSLPGLYIYLTNNPNTNSGALEIGAVTVFDGAHSYEIPDVSVDDFTHILYFCKPFSVKVGDGEIK